MGIFLPPFERVVGNAQRLGFGVLHEPHVPVVMASRGSGKGVQHLAARWLDDNDGWLRSGLLATEHFHRWYPALAICYATDIEDDDAVALRVD